MRRARASMGITVITTVVVVVALASSASSISQAKLASELLSSSQMPAGWTLSSAGSSDGVGCIHGLLEPRGVMQTHSAQVYFLGTVDDLPRFDEKVATYSNTKSAYNKIITRIDACHTLTGLFDGLQISGSVSPMSFGHVGDASAAYAMTISDARARFATTISSSERVPCSPRSSKGATPRSAPLSSSNSWASA